MKNPSIDDNSAQKWGKFLIPNVQKRCSDIFGKFGCPEAPELGSPWWPSSNDVELKIGKTVRIYYSSGIFKYQNHLLKTISFNKLIMMTAIWK